MEDWAVHSFNDMLVAVPSDGVNIIWETFPAVLLECPEDRDKVTVYARGSIVIFCKRIDGRWQVDTAFVHKMKFKATPEALYQSNGWGMEWTS